VGSESFTPNPERLRRDLDFPILSYERLVFDAIHSQRT
jgi:hypothetical protein